ncbi:PPC domain-containing protein [Oculatella sp. FACHB-28]|uniref:PPC domain-containing protein n=1 Tax=Oculatella sp. FACHB-28 TaxID=2692845 RepID=UPI00168367F8|nr:PPC domain-containing protein [Oculatella sp. FACHB-28]MBD2055089.1 PPC domain-containing protein [Oculatella sp. FACHB-28]
MRFHKIGSISLVTLLMTLLIGGLGSVALSQKQPSGLSGNMIKAIAPSAQTLPNTKQNQSNEQIILDIQGALEEGDLVLPQDGSLYDEHTFEGRAGQSVAIDLESADFDTFLILLDPQERIVGQHDDVSQDNFNSTLNVTLPVDGTYTVIANGFDSNSRGRYQLLIRTPTQSASR